MIDEANNDSAELDRFIHWRPSPPCPFIRILKKAYNDASFQDKAATAANV